MTSESCAMIRTAEPTMRDLTAPLFLIFFVSAQINFCTKKRPLWGIEEWEWLRRTGGVAPSTVTARNTKRGEEDRVSALSSGKRSGREAVSLGAV